MKKIIIIIFALVLSVTTYAQRRLTGRVVDSLNAGISGATVTISGLNKSSVSTNSNGDFTLNSTFGKLTLLVSHVSYDPKELSIEKDNNGPIIITLQPKTGVLQEVIVSTGYQKIPKERATGSFVRVDNDLVNRRVSTDVLSRLEDVTSGLLFNRGATAKDRNDISIRGRSTIYANSKPLIVIDNFPYDGDLANINPNDVDNITVLKDAAATSIWGARSGNGVIVITTKKGKFNRPVKVGFNSNITVGSKPDQYYLSKMSSSDFIDVEKKLFDEGYYTAAEQSPANDALTPVVELLIAKRDGTIAAAEADKRIEALKQYDVRNDFDHYLQQRSINQQYALTLSGGTPSDSYYLSAGYDKNRDNLVRNGYSRWTISGNNTYSILKDKLSLNTGIYYTSSKTDLPNGGPGNVVLSSGYLYPYARLADEEGKSLTLPKDYRTSFTNSALAAGLLDWNYRPLDELQIADNRSNQTDYRLNASLQYHIVDGLSVAIYYQYNKSSIDGRNLQSQQSYFTRNLINNYTQTNSDGTLYRAIPLGGILDQTTGEINNYNLRYQLNYEKTFNQAHEINAIGGYEERSLTTTTSNNRLYGYDDDHLLSRPVDYVNNYNLYYYPGAIGQIPYANSQTKLTDHYRSYYFNGSYIYNSKYILSASARLDQSNLFGVNTNQKGTPLWSAGIAWNLSQEYFYHISWLPYAKLRLTYGYSGNIDKTVSAYTVATSNPTAATTGLPYAIVRSPANPDLRWERVKVINAAIDFSTKNARIEGSIEYYRKTGVDLVGNTAFPPSSGITSFRGNSANTLTEGLDVTLAKRILTGKVQWTANTLFSVNKEKVTSYKEQSAGYNYLYYLGTPLTGKPLYSIYSYKWGGLDHETGDPIGFLNNTESKDYAAISTSATGDNLVYNGPARPTVYGAFRNTFSFGQIAISANISYRLGYYYRQPSVYYAAVSTGIGGHGDYALRWQQPGDETKTNVPSIPQFIDTERDDFYTYSSVLVKKGDHIRLQDVSVTYTFSAAQIKKLPLKTIQIYAYANNLGIIWKSEKGTLDPDYTLSNPPVKTFALGIRSNF